MAILFIWGHNSFFLEGSISNETYERASMTWWSQRHKYLTDEEISAAVVDAAVVDAATDHASSAAVAMVEGARAPAAAPSHL